MEEVMACAGPNTHLTFWGRTVHHVQSQHQIWDDDDKNNMWESSLLYKEIYEYELSLCTNRVIVVEDDWIGILKKGEQAWLDLFFTLSSNLVFHKM